LTKLAQRGSNEGVKPHLKGRWIRKSTRNAIYERDDYKCGYCGKDLSKTPAAGIVLDHVDPEGGNEQKNLKTACKECNDSKGGKKVVDFLREKSKNPSMPIKLPSRSAKNAKAKKPKAKAKKPMAAAAKAALLARLAKGRKAAAKGKAPKKARKPMADALGVSEDTAPVSKVNKPGTAKAKRQAKAKSPRRISTKAKPDTRGMSKVTTTRKTASNLI